MDDSGHSTPNITLLLKDVESHPEISWVQDTESGTRHAAIQLFQLILVQLLDDHQDVCLVPKVDEMLGF